MIVGVLQDTVHILIMLIATSGSFSVKNANKKENILEVQFWIDQNITFF